MSPATLSIFKIERIGICAKAVSSQLAHRAIMLPVRRLAQHKRFGASSEKTNPDQLELNLFNEAEVLATPKGHKPETEKVTYERRKPAGKREADLSDRDGEGKRAASVPAP